MKIPQLTMQATFPQLSITVERGYMHMRQQQAEMSIEQPKPQLEMKTTPPRLTIDQTEAWADMDLKHIFRRIEEAAQDGYASWLSYLETTAIQGDELMRIEQGGDVLAMQAQANSERPPFDYNVGLIPRPFSVKVSFEPGHINMNWQTSNARIHIEPRLVQIDYKPNVVHIDLARHNNLRIDVTV
ncbi:hypothetical protein BO219_07155 [Anoxybacillus kestanbolensis]|uniref:YviE n=1 Tax=Anoxybacillus kestanbolensis TaxID=227476 RepID=A0A1V3FPQ6_9BACL|nr:DUF6470 family protein [Anoxybacillus kestanbolensis]OOE03589.1 hypothetical protein BO219_07155 [Anoxybacillus kestanbolensis]